MSLPEPYYSKDGIVIFCGDCREILPKLPPNSVDSIVTDPPYGLGFMGKAWDHSVPSSDVWRESLRVLKPGGHLLAFAGTRTQHRMACRIEDAGFEIRDMIAWVYGSGFPKSLDVSKAIDKAAGIDTKRFKAWLRSVIEKSGITRKELDSCCGFTMRFDTPYEDDKIGWGVSLPSPEKWAVIKTVLGVGSTEWDVLLGRVWRGRAGDLVSPNDSMSGGNFQRTSKGKPVTEAARQWDGWGTALKPALEPITVARKPLSGTVAQNVLEHGTGAINVDGCRVGTEESLGRFNHERSGGTSYVVQCRDGMIDNSTGKGRFPANLIHDGSEEVLRLFPKNAGACAAASGPTLRNGSESVARGRYNGLRGDPAFHGDSGSAARFFYCAKASRSEREEGCAGIDPVQMDDSRKEGDPGGDNPRNRGVSKRGNSHPTVKPLALMRYLVRLVTPPGGVTLDMFTGSGSTGIAAFQEGKRFIGIEIEEKYCEIAVKRLAQGVLL